MVNSRINPATGKRNDWVDPNAPDPKELEARVLQQQIALFARQQVIQKAREKFMTFVKFTSPDPEAMSDASRSTYKNAKHHDAIARVIEEVEKGNIEFLILTMPPRHGKSELVSRRLPAWYSGLHPEQNIVVATYNDSFAEDFGKEVRSIMTSPQFKQVFPTHKLERGGAASDRMKTTKGGQLSFVGRGGSLTGRGAHLMIIDDLIKDDKEASSDAIRNQAWNWLNRVAMTRMMGRKLVIMTFTRWHADDPIGRLTDPDNIHYSRELAETIKVINLPAIAEEDDPLGREPGDPLWPGEPNFYDLKFLKRKQLSDPQGFASLYQQRPTAIDGDLFKLENVNYYDELPKDMRIYAASDHAVGEKQRNDLTCLLIVGIDKQANIYIIDRVWQRMPTDKTVEEMLRLVKTHKPIQWWAERGHISKSIGPFLRKRMQETETYFSIVEVTPVADKAQRAASIIGRFAQSKVFWPNGTQWVQKAVNELLAFPNGAHDDFVDALAYIGLGLQSQFGPGAGVAKKEPPKYGTLNWVKQQDRWFNDQKKTVNSGGFY